MGYPDSVRPQIVDEIMRRVGENTGAAVAGAWRSFVVVALMVGILVGLSAGRLKIRAGMIAMTLLLAIDLWTVEHEYWIFSPRASVLFASDAAIEAIRADIDKNGPGRVFNAAASSSVDPLDRFLCVGLCQDVGRGGDILMVHGLRIPAGYHGNEMAIYQRLIEADSGRAQLQPRFWQHENVRYWYTAADSNFVASASTQLGVQPFVRLAGPVKNAAGTTVYAYKMGPDNPPAWIASAIVKAPPAPTLATILDSRFDPRAVAIADTSATNIPGVSITAPPAAATTSVQVTHYAPGAIDLALDEPSRQGQALVFSENYFPGWQATVDGRPAPIGLMNYNLIGVALPPGSKSVELRFTDAAYQKGKVVTLVALLLAAVLWIGGWIVDRRKSVPAAG